MINDIGKFHEFFNEIAEFATVHEISQKRDERPKFQNPCYSDF